LYFHCLVIFSYYLTAHHASVPVLPRGNQDGNQNSGEPREDGTQVARTSSLDQN
jgi:hypothetical protein